jgi:hypothetical protein
MTGKKKKATGGDRSTNPQKEQKSQRADALQKSKDRERYEYKSLLMQNNTKKAKPPAKQSTQSKEELGKYKKEIDKTMIGLYRTAAEGKGIVFPDLNQLSTNVNVRNVYQNHFLNLKKFIDDPDKVKSNFSHINSDYIRAYNQKLAELQVPAKNNVAFAAASAKEEADVKAKEEADRKAKEEADRKAKEEADRKAKEEADVKAKEEADVKAKEEADVKAKEEADRKAKEEADRKAEEEADRKAEADKKAKAEADKKAKAEAKADADKKLKGVLFVKTSAQEGFKHEIVTKGAEYEPSEDFGITITGSNNAYKGEKLNDSQVCRSTRTYEAGGVFTKTRAAIIEQDNKGNIRDCSKNLKKKEKIEVAYEMARMFLANRKEGDTSAIVISHEGNNDPEMAGMVHAALLTLAKVEKKEDIPNIQNLCLSKDKQPYMHEVTFTDAAGKKTITYRAKTKRFLDTGGFLTTDSQERHKTEPKVTAFKDELDAIKTVRTNILKQAPDSNASPTPPSPQSRKP